MNLFDHTGYAQKQFPILFEDSIKKEEPVYHGTLSLGIAVSGNMGSFGVGGALFITIDAQGNIALQNSLSGGGTTEKNENLFSASFMPFAMVTNAPNYNAIEGAGVQTGLSLVKCVIDYVGCQDRSGLVIYHGLFIAGGLSTPGFHISGGETRTIHGGPFDWELYYDITQY